MVEVTFSHNFTMCLETNGAMKSLLVKLAVRKVGQTMFESESECLCITLWFRNLFFFGAFFLFVTKNFAVT